VDIFGNIKILKKNNMEYKEEEQFMKGMKAGLEEAHKHDEPSPKTLELISALKDDISLVHANQTAHHEILTRVETKVTATNGRVRSLEKFKSFVGGAIAVISAIVVPILIFIIQQIIIRPADSKIAERVIEELAKQAEITEQKNNN
jgi:hypothetical protein